MRQTAYEMAIREREASVEYKNFVDMIGKGVRDFGRLRLGDILQYMTVGQVKDLESDDPELVYRTFVLHNQSTDKGMTKHKIIRFDGSMGDMTDDEKLSASYDLLSEEDRMGNAVEICQANPELIRNMSYFVTVSDDVLQPLSKETEKQYKLEEYDRAIANPLLDQEVVAREFLLSAYPASQGHVDKFFKKPQAPSQFGSLMGTGLPGGMQPPEQGGGGNVKQNFPQVAQRQNQPMPPSNNQIQSRALGANGAQQQQ